MRIRRFEISNFRSLESISVGSVTGVAVFHGENNTGKSNLLAALEAVFRSKVGEAKSRVPSEELPATRVTPFYYGRLQNFSDSFRLGSSEPIRFNIRLEASAAEITSIHDLDRAVVHLPAGQGHSHRITLIGAISQSGNDGVMRLEEARLNNTILYKSEPGGATSYFPSLGKLSAEEKERAAEALLGHMTDLVTVVESDRYLTAESLEGNSELSSRTFKRWLHRLSLSRDDFPVYQKILEAFDGSPFNFGKLGFAEDKSELEIMILDKNSQRLPIGRLGTGVQQILMLLARILQGRAQIVGVEELELNLSYRNQDLVLNKLTDLVRDTEFPLSQLLLTTHSDHLGSRSDASRYRVMMDKTATQVRRFTLDDRRELYPHSRGWRRHFYSS